MSAIKLRLKNDFSVKAAYLARRDASVWSPCLMVLENDYLNAICNLFTMPEWEGSGGKTIWRWSEMGSVAEAGDTSEGRLVREVRPGCFRWKIKIRTAEMRWSRCRWLPQPEWILSSFLMSSEDTNHPALCLPVSHFYSLCVCSQRLSESLGCCSLAFISPLGSNVLQHPLSMLPIDGIQRHYVFRCVVKVVTLF